MIRRLVLHVIILVESLSRSGVTVAEVVGRCTQVCSQGCGQVAGEEPVGTVDLPRGQYRGQ